MITYKERQQRHAVLLHRAENALDRIENKQERERARDILFELKARGASDTYNENIADFFARCGFHLSGSINNKSLYKIKFSVDE